MGNESDDDPPHHRLECMNANQTFYAVKFTVFFSNESPNYHQDPAQISQSSARMMTCGMVRRVDVNTSINFTDEVKGVNNRRVEFKCIQPVNWKTSYNVAAMSQPDVTTT